MDIHIKLADVSNNSELNRNLSTYNLYIVHKTKIKHTKHVRFTYLTNHNVKYTQCATSNRNCNTITKQQ
jgi:hypothetical protein